MNEIIRPRRVGIRTEFSGISFRSRQEAKWARTFTTLKLAWDYEPDELGGWIPDFDLRFSKKPILVEVKALNEDIYEAKAKIDRCWPGDAVVAVSGESCCIGEIYEAETGWDRAIMGWCTKCLRPTICSESGRWGCRNCGADSRSLWWAWNPRAAWAEACNETQWRKPT